MAEKRWENEIEKLDRLGLAIEDLDRWNPETTEVLNDLFRALRRKKGFGLFFVECNPARAEQVMKAIQGRFPQKKLIPIELDRKNDTLYGELWERYQEEKFDIACITGVEQVLYGYEDTKRLAGWSSEEIYSYSWKGVPPLLSHLNRQREAFEANLPISLIFFVRSFAIDYFIQRAPDFFDWRSGFFKFSEISRNLQKLSHDLVSEKYKNHLALSPDRVMEKIFELRDRILKIDPSDFQEKSNLLVEQGKLFELLYPKVISLKLETGFMFLEKKNSKNLTRALNCYDRAIQKNPNNKNAWISKANLLALIGRYEEALASYDCVLKKQPQNCSVLMSKGNLLILLGKYKEAIKIYNCVLEDQPQNCDIIIYKGVALHNLEQYEKALANYDRALQIQPQNYDILVYKGDILCSLKRHKDAIKIYDCALENRPVNSETWSSDDLIINSLNRYQEDINRNTLVVKIKKTPIELWDAKGVIFCNYLYDYNNALASFDRVVEVQPNSHLAWHNRGIALSRLQRYEEAVQSYDRALEIQPDYYLAWYNRGVVLFNLKRYEEAVQSYDRALEIQPDYYLAWHNRGVILGNLQRYEEALQSYDRALEIQPDYHYAWYGRGIFLRKLGRYEESGNSALKALVYSPEKGWYFKFILWVLLKTYFNEDLYLLRTKIQPNNSELWNARGYSSLVRYSYKPHPIAGFGNSLLIRQPQNCNGSQNITEIDLERCQKALEYFDTALNLDPEFTIAWANRSFPAYYLRQYQTALESCNKALELDPENEKKMHEVIYSNRGCILLQLQDLTAALEDFTTALEIAPNLDEAWNGRGTALYRLGRYNEALECFTRALKLNHPLAQANLDLTQQHLP